MEQYARVQMPVTGIDAQSALQLSNTRDIVDDILIDLSGLQKIYENDTIKYIRVSKPKVTFEFAKDLITNIYIEVNRLTARTHYSAEQIDHYLYKQCETMIDWFCVTGFKNLVSDAAWYKCIDLAKTDPDGIKITTEEGFFQHNFWFTKHQILWNKNQPFNMDMLKIIKTEYNLENEAFSQDIILRNLFWSIRILIHGGLNRSLEHLTLDHEKVIHKESMVTSSTDGDKPSEGYLERIKNRFRKT